MKASRSLVSFLVLLVLAAFATGALAERADDADRKSKNGKTMGTIAGVDVALEFGRPNVKGREIWGGLVPFGKIWRTGADEATTVTFSGDVMVEGQKLKAGTYSVFTIPGADKWTFIFNKVAEQWGHYNYDSGQDALRVDVEPKMVADSEESMNFVIDGSSVVLRWEKLAVGFEVSA